MGIRTLDAVLTRMPPLAVALIVSVGSACAPGLVATYSVGIVDVERSPGTEARFGIARVAEVTEEGGSTYLVEDDLIRLELTIQESRLPFELTNKTDQPVTLNWNDALYVDLRGAPHKVMHSEVRYEDRRELQDAEVIPPGESERDFFLPVHLVYLTPEAQWREQPLFTPYRRMTLEELQPALANRGRTFALFLPLETGGAVFEYMVTFRITDVTLP